MYNISKQNLLTFLGFLLLLSNVKFSVCDPNGVLTVACGASGEGKDVDNRAWEPDTKYLATQANSQAMRAQFQEPALPSEVPYMTARVSPSELSYKFPVNSTSRYFLRLHFYPAPYGSFDTKNSYFSVSAGGITLLNNFSASISAYATTQAYIIKEYSLAPKESGGGTLEVVFKPSDKYHGSFVFVNGIELVPTPHLFDAAALVGFTDQTLDGKSANVETIVRLNVGGNFISPTNDSGLLRTWYDDEPYLAGAESGVSLSDNNTVGSVDYRNTPKYMAPVGVYDTWRSMGPEPKITLAYNLTWEFSVDPGFSYIARLHFCEHIYTKTNQRPFIIYINNHTALGEADVIAWTGAQNVPTYKDFAVNIPNAQNKQQLTVALHPMDNSDPKPEFFDALLNGLELFKAGDGTKNLAGLNPIPSEPLIRDTESRNDFIKDRANIKVIGTATGVAAAFGIATALAVVMYKKKSKMPRSKSGTSSWLPLHGNSHTGGMKSTIGGNSVASAQLSNEAAANCRHLTLAEIKKATKNFDESYVIGVGGFGKVYKGVIDGNVKVAIKKSNPSSEQGVNEFVTEIEMLSKLRHKHLVSLIGYCEEDGEMALVYDFMAHGTLREHLYKNNKTNLTWKQRLEILIGAAKGLHYLHTGSKYTIIHRDVKTTNILLDENWVAKVSDFGLSKTGPDLNIQNHVSTVVKGSFGYLDPEYFRRQQLTEKSDVYSFGVVLFEGLCARPALNASLPKEQVSLADWALTCVRKGNIDEIIDPQIKGTIKPECLKKFVETAVKCLSDHGVDRPSMSDLLWNLEFSLQLQESGDAPKEGSSSRSTASDAMSVHLSTLDLDNDEEDYTSSNQENPSTVFSQFVNQTGR